MDGPAARAAASTPQTSRGTRLGAHGWTEGGVPLRVLIDLVHQGSQGVPPTHGLVRGLNNSNNRLQLEGCIFQGVCCAAHPAAGVAPGMQAAAYRLHNLDSYAWSGSIGPVCSGKLRGRVHPQADSSRACAMQQASQPASRQGQQAAKPSGRRQPAPLLQSKGE